MTDPREALARIRKQTDAATEGPWEWEGEAKAEWELGANSLVPSRRPDDPVLYGYGYDASGIEVKTPADAEFIAHARTDVPALVAALRAVLNLHFKAQPIPAAFGTQEGGDYCRTCVEDWPCPTVEAITTALNGDDQ
mgnify:FL=1